MQEPTFRQHKKLEELKNGFSMRKGDEDDMEIIWELVRMGLLKNFALLGNKYEWSFDVTKEGESYLSAVANGTVCKRPEEEGFENDFEMEKLEELRNFCRDQRSQSQGECTELFNKGLDKDAYYKAGESSAFVIVIDKISEFLKSESPQGVSDSLEASGDLHTGYQMECAADGSTNASEAVTVPLPKRIEAKEDCFKNGSKCHLVGLSRVCVKCGKDFNNLVDS